MRARQHPETHNAHIVHMRRVHDGLIIFRVRPGGAPLRARPGQHAVLGLLPDGRGRGTGGESLLRATFSVSSSILRPDATLIDPSTEAAAEFYVAAPEHSGDGPTFSTVLFAQSRGHGIWMSPAASGSYTLDRVRPEEDILFCATGTGEAPHNAMILDLLRRNHPGRIASVISCRRRADVAYLEVHRALEDRFPRYRYVALTTREPGDRGSHVQDLLLSGEMEQRIGFPVERGRTRVFLCGNAGMIGRPSHENGRRTYPEAPGMVQVLETDHGLRADEPDAPGDIHFERH